MSVRELAHELNSMLDGSMRYVTIAQQVLEQAATDAGSVDEATRRLAAAHEGMCNMASLLEQTIHGGVESHEHRRPLREQAERIMTSCAARAELNGVEMNLHMDDAVADVPIGPLGPVLLNGLRNAIDACIESDDDNREVEMSIGLASRERLEILIADTGPGVPAVMARGVSTKPEGHGIGLDLCKHITRSLGGSVELMSVPFGGGAVMRVLIPIRRLHRS